MRFFAFLFLCLPALGEVASNVVTNRFLISNEIEKRRWERTAIMADELNRPVDPTGQIVDYAEYVAAEYTAGHIGEISDAAQEATRVSSQRLLEVSGQIPRNAVHLALSLPRQDRDNLSALVVDEGGEGTNEWQVVRFSSLLASPPLRRIVYRFPGGEASVPVKWPGIWDTQSFEHRCEFTRPQVLAGTAATYKSRRHDVLGGPAGFGFGAAAVRVDGADAWSGSVTNRTTGQILTFKKGVLENAD